MFAEIPATCLFAAVELVSGFASPMETSIMESSAVECAMALGATSVRGH